jgi:hypothetical protein
MKKMAYIFLFSIICSLFSGFCFAQEDVVKIPEAKVAGEFFGVPVSIDNYRFVRAAAMIFGPKWGTEPKTPQELENRTWEDLLLSYEAYRRHIKVDDQEALQEITQLLKAEKVAFDEMKDKEAYAAWVKERVKEPVEVFENQIKHLLQLQKLRQQIIDSLEPSVSEDEAFQEYLNEYNTLALEFVQFDDLKSAEDFYRKMKNPKLWEKENKKNPKFSVRPGFVSLEFLMDIWKISKDDVYAMMGLPVGSVYRPAPIYKGYAVFHTLEKKAAEKEKFAASKQSYLDQVKRKKQYEGFGDWLKSFKKDAQIKIFTTPGNA